VLGKVSQGARKSKMCRVKFHKVLERV